MQGLLHLSFMVSNKPTGTVRVILQKCTQNAHFSYWFFLNSYWHHYIIMTTTVESLLVCLYAVFDSPDKASRRSEGTAWGRTALFNMGSTLFEDLTVSKVPDPIPAGRREWVEGEFQSREMRNSVYLNSSVFIDSGQMNMNTFKSVI